VKKYFAVFTLLLCTLSAHAAANAPAQASSADIAGPPSSDTPAALAAIDPTKKADIAQLMDVMGMKSMMSQTFDQMMASIRPQLINGLPPGDYREKLADLFFQKFQSKLSIQVMIDMATIAYDKYLSDEDIKGLTQFYQTPLGKKTLETLPKLTVDIGTQSTQLGEKLGQESMQEVLDEHPELKKALEDASK
jgi:hypothetical protein